MPFSHKSQTRLLQQVIRLSLIVFTCINSALGYGAEDAEEDIQLAINRLENYPDIEEWTVTTTDKTIRIVSKFSISATESRAILVDEFDEEEWKQNSTSKFWIEIRFEKIPPYSTYQSLREERQKWADLLNEDLQSFEGEPLSDADYDKAWKFLTENPLPSHLAAYSYVYISSILDDDSKSIDLDENLQKSLFMLYRIGFLFSEIVK